MKTRNRIIGAALATATAIGVGSYEYVSTKAHDACIGNLTIADVPHHDFSVTADKTTTIPVSGSEQRDFFDNKHLLVIQAQEVGKQVMISMKAEDDSHAQFDIWSNYNEANPEFVEVSAGKYDQTRLKQAGLRPVELSLPIPPASASGSVFLMTEVERQAGLTRPPLTPDLYSPQRAEDGGPDSPFDAVLRLSPERSDGSVGMSYVDDMALSALRKQVCG